LVGEVRPGRRGERVALCGQGWPATVRGRMNALRPSSRAASDRTAGMAMCEMPRHIADEAVCCRRRPRYWEDVVRKG